MRLAVFSGQIFSFDGKNYSTDEAFVKFVTFFRHYFNEIIFCDPVKQSEKSQAYVLDSAYTQVCPLPYFSLYSLWQNPLVFFPKVYRVIKQSVDSWDVVWLHAPHPISLILVHICTKLHKPFFFFVRQDLGVYVGHRNQGPKRILGSTCCSFTRICISSGIPKDTDVCGRSESV